MHCKYLWSEICSQLNWSEDDLSDNSWKSHLHKMYWKDEKSGTEIAAYINQNTDEKILITPRSIQRRLKAMGGCRTAAEGFRLAAKNGKVKWAWKDGKIKRRPLSNATRVRILERDNHRCKMCGATASESRLEIDHIIPVCQNGRDDDFNLQVLCHECNVGKRIHNKEV